jgi:putative hemolysin
MFVWLELSVVILLILLNALFAISEMALVSVNRARLSVLEQQGVPGAARARVLAEDPERFLPTVQVGITLISIISGVFGGAHVAEELAPTLIRAGLPLKMAGGVSLAVVVVGITYLTLVLGELVPKQIALRHPERIAARVAPFLAGTAAIVGPFVWVLRHSSALVLRLLGAHRAVGSAVTEEELRALLAEGEQSGVIETEERGMIERVLRLADKPVRAIMTPRTELAWIDRTDTPAEIVATLTEAPHSRIVVCDGGVDNPVGVVWAKDLLDMVLRGQEMSIGAVLRQPAVMPDTVTALDALERLRSDQLALAFVMDEYGSFEGLVTAVDVLHAITGEPDDAEGDGGGIPADGVLALDGMMPVDEVKERLRLPTLPAAGSYHTLAGLLLALLRRVPRVGDRIVFGGWLFEVTQMDGRRVDRVRASREALAEG